MTLPKPAPDFCRTCGRRAMEVIETRRLSGAKRRRYRCRCGTRWSTYEMRISPRQLRPAKPATR